jgi:hypothetical protein
MALRIFKDNAEGKSLRVEICEREESLRKALRIGDTLDSSPFRLTRNQTNILEIALERAKCARAWKLPRLGKERREKALTGMVQIKLALNAVLANVNSWNLSADRACMPRPRISVGATASHKHESGIRKDKVKTRPEDLAVEASDVLEDAVLQAHACGNDEERISLPSARGKQMSLVKTLKKMEDGKRNLGALYALIKMRNGTIKRKEFEDALELCGVKVEHSTGGHIRLTNTHTGRIKSMTCDTDRETGTVYMLQITRSLTPDR